MRHLTAVRIAWLLTAALPQLACAQGQGEVRYATAEEAVRAGQYEAAIRLGETAVARDPGDEAARRALVAALAEVGRYEEAERAAGGLANLRGEMLLARGLRDEAAAAFREEIDAEGPDRWTAELNLAVLYYDRGERDEAFARFDRFIDLYNSGRQLTPAELTAVGTAVWYLGATDPDLFRDAVMAFDEASAADPDYLEPALRIGELFLEKYNSPDAVASFRQVLERHASHPRGLLGLARARAFEGDRAEALELVRRSLEVNPDLVAARVQHARMLLDAERAAEAEEEIRHALSVNPSSLRALSVLAAVHFVRDEDAEYERVRRQVHELNPVYEGLYITVAEIAAQHRRYAAAAGLAVEAVRLNPRSWQAHGILGLNLFRLGDIAEAREALERSFAGDPYNVWIKNTLDLLDTFDEYDVRSLAGFDFMLHRDEADLLYPYIEELARESHALLTERYRARTTGAIRIEVFPRRADFSVRTVGLAGLGALGVSFGNVLALDSPSARERGTFNWASTLWHEMAHAVHLAASGNRVPRWLTEGLSVLEERRARPSWGSETTPELVLAYDAGELPPLSRLNEAFMRPPSPQHIGYAYHLSSLVAEWIEETRGFDAIVAMLSGYRDGRGTDELIRRVLGAEPEVVDDEFDRWFRARYSVDSASRFASYYALGRRYYNEGRLDDAKQSLTRAVELFPASAGGSPYALLARIHLDQGDEGAAIEALTRLTLIDETAYSPNLELARLLEARGDRRGAAEALERAVWIYPFDAAVHTQLAELYTELGEHEKAVRERRAMVALRPVDRAEAYFQLAAALHEAGDVAAARTEVLRALELAPAHQRAQDLLLRLHESR